jgi:hypothetical protein
MAYWLSGQPLHAKGGHSGHAKGRHSNLLPHELQTQISTGVPLLSLVLWVTATPFDNVRNFPLIYPATSVA